ncbi:MAG TPA: tRNA (adenosine(37)-N6)-threonylcarbamoyltransferase complex dimerization subunit type 1 TsaB, partial [Vicinamibacteria bacterium]|nr:tRNA (adenosine(37)-N6)-threonylcarbamoyltransferase complex dimerization subunit type 1 TsaB [Vicinamibacteria bacterium]
LPAVALLLEGEGQSASDIDGFACTLGPGSFTGLRVGISTVQGLALGAGRPCLGLPALDVLAARIAESAPFLVAAMDAYRDQVFTRLYDSLAHPQGEAVVLGKDAFLDWLPEDVALLGDGAVRYEDAIRTRKPGCRFPRRSLFLAGTLARMAAPRFAAGEGVPPSSLIPLYMREADVRRHP